MLDRQFVVAGRHTQPWSYRIGRLCITTPISGVSEWSKLEISCGITLFYSLCVGMHVPMVNYALVTNLIIFSVYICATDKRARANGRGWACLPLASIYPAVDVRCAKPVCVDVCASAKSCRMQDRDDLTRSWELPVGIWFFRRCNMHWASLFLYVEGTI